jgi:hypothetical protein
VAAGQWYCPRPQRVAFESPLIGWVNFHSDAIRPIIPQAVLCDHDGELTGSRAKQYRQLRRNHRDRPVIRHFEQREAIGVCKPTENTTGQLRKSNQLTDFLTAPKNIRTKDFQKISRCALREAEHPASQVLNGRIGCFELTITISKI